MAISGVRNFFGRLRAPVTRARILVRQSPDWRNTPHAELLEGSRAFCRMVGAATGLTENFISDVVGVWDETFPLRYFEVRALMKDIARQNLAVVRNATITTLAAARGETSTHDLQLFIDDDDWLDPQLCRQLAPHLERDADGYIFGNILCVSRIELRRVEDGCYTNNYAVAGRFLQRLGGNCERVAQHWDANQAFHQADFRCIHVPVYLSATNKHPASAMKLKDGLQQAELSSATLRGLVERYVDESARATLPPQAAWVRPHVWQVRDVFARLLQR